MLAEEHALATPSRQIQIARRPESPIAFASQPVGSECRLAFLDDSLNDTLNDSPQLPDHFQPLDYDLLEYAVSLPPKLAERISQEMDVREQHVTRLRESNEQLARAAVAATQRLPPAGATAASSAQQFAAIGAPTSAGAEAAAASLAAEVATRQAESEAEAARSARAIEKAHSLQLEVLQVEEATDAQLTKIAARCNAARQSVCVDDPDKGVTTQNGPDERASLREALAKLHCLRERASQLERTHQQAERRAQNRDQELRLLRADCNQLRAEVQGFRTQAVAFSRAEQKEEELRRELREAKAELRRCEKAPPSTIAEPVGVVFSEAEVAAGSGVACSKPKLRPASTRPHPRREATPQKVSSNERVQRSLPVGGGSRPATPQREAAEPSSRASSLGIKCLSRANTERSPLRYVPSPLRALARLGR